MSGAEGRRREFDWRSTAVALAMLAAALMGLAVLYGADVADVLADRIFAQARAPFDREMPSTATAQSYTAADIQVIGGQGLGLSCSIPPLLEWIIFKRKDGEAPVSLQYRQACAFHDYCYRHGAATYGYGQADCDYLLLDHAYRLCRFIPGSDDGVKACITKARKVVLGVRLGGNAHFKRPDWASSGKGNTQSPQQCRQPNPAVFDDPCTSTYFEFDPYPIRSAQFRAYRIADAPAGWHGKALYTFDTKPSGTRLSIWGRASDGNPVCRGYMLPGNYRYIAATPIVIVDRGPPDGPADRFVWWRRYAINQTGGRFAILDPKLAQLADWATVFPGASQIDTEQCRHHSGPSPGASATGSAFEIEAGANRVAPDDNQFSEVHPAPSLEPERNIRLIALRTHSCLKDKNVLCMLDIILRRPGRDGAEMFQRQEPRVVRDLLSDTKDGLREKDRYRNFVSAPIPMSGGGDRAALSWMRRGESNGDGYESSAVLRRVVPIDNTSQDGGLVLISQFYEEDEPVAVVDRARAGAGLISVSAHGEDVILKLWRLPDLANGADTPQDSKPDVLTPEPSIDSSWLTRPPLLLRAEDDATELVFSRMAVRRDGAVVVEFKVLRLMDAGDVKEKEPPQMLDIGATAPDVGSEEERTVAEAFRRLRARPALLNDMDLDGCLDVIVPDADDLSAPIFRKFDAACQSRSTLLDQRSANE